VARTPGRTHTVGTMSRDDHTFLQNNGEVGGFAGGKLPPLGSRCSWPAGASAAAAAAAPAAWQ